MRGRRTSPIRGSYWVQPDRFLVGRYPTAWNKARLAAKLRRLLRAGLTFFLDLTEKGEKSLAPYDPLLRKQAAALGTSVEYRRMPAPDFETPTVEEMSDVLDTIDAALAEGHAIYLHCFAGVGRTGTVVGCYLVRHGLSGEEALSKLFHLRQGTDLEGVPSPVTPEQEEMVLDWAELDPTMVERG